MITFATDLGTCGVRWSAAGITEVFLPGARPLQGTALDAAPDVPVAIAQAVEAMTALLAGERRDLTAIALDESGLDPFRRGVYAATRAIGAGETASYGQIARAIGAPDAARAVGAALGANPCPIVVPCHRVLAADGALTGFSAPGGVVTKRRLLEIEQAPGFTQQALFAV
jgi:methylated-DNA-[protein]-cysteine S-methyltransferase